MKLGKTIKTQGLVSLSESEYTDDRDRYLKRYEVSYWRDECWITEGFKLLKDAEAFFAKRVAEHQAWLAERSPA